MVFIIRANPSHLLLLTRAPYSTDVMAVMDRMNASITTCISQLGTALSNMPLSQRQPLQQLTHQPPQTQTPESLSKKIETSMYNHRKLDNETWRTTAMTHYDQQIDKLKALDKERTKGRIDMLSIKYPT